MVDERGNDRRRRERDLPKDAASLHWYDAEGTSYHSAESQARKSSRAPPNTDASVQILPVSAPVLCVQLASKGGGSARDRTRVLKSVARASRPAVSPPCAHGRDTLNVADHYLIEVSRAI
jgi:hypothetical protein